MRTLEQKVQDPKDMVAVAQTESGEIVDTTAVEQAGVAYDPYSQHLDLSKEEKRRTTSLMLAIQAYQHLIVKDAEYLIAVAREARENPDLKLKPATISAITEAAIEFDWFISGKHEEAPAGDPSDERKQEGR